VLLSAASMVAYLVAPMAIIAHLTRRDRVDGQALLAAIAAYILVGMFFTFGYNLIALLSPVPTFGEGHADSLTSQLFFSFTTLTTTGYGNIVPVGLGVQSVAIAEAITGQLFLVIAVARVVSGWTRPAKN
jgi:ABC-type molybdate transport system permease subunit